MSQYVAMHEMAWRLGHDLAIRGQGVLLASRHGLLKKVTEFVSQHVTIVLEFWKKGIEIGSKQDKTTCLQAPEKSENNSILFHMCLCHELLRKQLRRTCLEWLKEITMPSECHNMRYVEIDTSKTNENDMYLDYLRLIWIIWRIFNGGTSLNMLKIKSVKS